MNVFFRRRNLRVLLFLVLGALLGAAVAAPQKRVLRSADVHPEDYPTVQAMLSMGQALQRQSAGRLSIQVFHSGLLGDEAPLLELVQAGKLDMNRVSLQALEQSAPLARVLSLPYLFRDVDHLHKVMDGPIGREILDSLDAIGLVGLAFYDAGIRNVYTTRPLQRVEDFRDLTIRVQPSPMAAAYFAALRARPVALPFVQTGRALNNRIVEAAENNLPTYASTEHFRVAPYYILTRHSTVPDVLVMSRQTWNSLSAADQALVRKTAQDSVELMRDMWQQREERVEASLKLSGIGFIELPPAEVARLVQVAQGIHARFASSPKQQELIKRIRAVQ